MSAHHARINFEHRECVPVLPPQHPSYKKHFPNGKLSSSPANPELNIQVWNGSTAHLQMFSSHHVRFFQREVKWFQRHCLIVA